MFPVVMFQALAIAILIIHHQTIEEPVPFNMLVVTGTYVGFTIIIVGSFLGFMTGNSINKSVVSASLKLPRKLLK